VIWTLAEGWWWLRDPRIRKKKTIHGRTLVRLCWVACSRRPVRAR
jgi:hypothetical protein